jgi:hypothetical protein
MMDEYERPLSLDKYLKELATARAGGGQASDTPIAAMQNFSSTVSTTGDSATPPSAQVGMEIAVANNGANSMNVFRHREVNRPVPKSRLRRAPSPCPSAGWRADGGQNGAPITASYARGEDFEAFGANALTEHQPTGQLIVF